MARILVVGAGGFIGRALCPGLASRGHQVIAGLRRQTPLPDGIEPRILGDVTPGRDWSGSLADADIVIHLAQQAHRRSAPGGLAAEPAAAAGLAGAAAGARRFIYLSSVRAMGDATPPGAPFRASDPPRPCDAYGRAKLATEQALAAGAAERGLELVIIRPPLVYGPAARGNFRALARLVGSGLPLPLGGLDNRRSLIFIDNLVDLIAAAAEHPQAPGNVLLAADSGALSTSQLARLLALGQGRTAHLFALPGFLFAAGRRLPVIGPAVAALSQSLEVDDSATRALLDWAPPAAGKAAVVASARALAAR